MILVSGGTGVVGAGVTREMVRRGKPVAVMGRDRAKVTRRFANMPVDARAGDVRNIDSLREAFKGIDVSHQRRTVSEQPNREQAEGLHFRGNRLQGHAKPDCGG